MSAKHSLVFNEPRFRMTFVGRAVFRIAYYSLYGIIVAAAAVMLITKVPLIRSLGVLTVLFIFDRLIHLRRAARSLDLVDRARGPLNVAKFLTPASYKVIEGALDASLVHGGDVSLAIMKSLIQRRDVKNMLVRLDVAPEEFERKVDDYFEKSQKLSVPKEKIVQEIARVSTRAFYCAHNLRNHYIEPRDLFAALGGSESEPVSRLFNLFDISADELEYALVAVRASLIGKKARRRHGFIGRRYTRRHRVMNRAWTARPTPTLDRFGADLTDEARVNPVSMLVGHLQEYDRLIDVLSRDGRPNALLVGDPGVGKGALVRSLAWNIIRDRVPKPLFDKRLVELPISSLVVDASEGELEGRMKRIISEIVAAGNVILYIPDIQNLVDPAGKRASVADILVPAIKGTAFSVIGAATPGDFKRRIESSGELAAAFELIRIQELSEAEAAKFLTYEAILLEAKHKILVSIGAIEQSVALAKKFFRDRPLPASAVDLLREAVADAASREKKMLLADDVIAVVERRVNVPIHKAGGVEAAELLNLESVIHEEFVGQDAAVSAVANALREYRSGLAKSGRPIAVFLFVGPTGVGKTELSKRLAKIHFGSESAMIRLDMSEYQTKESVFSLIGSPKGEVGGALTEAVREKPYSLVLLDEFEKAHPDILNLFLSVFDDGRLVDNLGRTVNFENTIIVATSNAHSNFVKSSIESGMPEERLSVTLKQKLTDYFKPELLNRFSAIIVFRNLTSAEIESVARLQIKDLAATIEKSRGLKLFVTDAAVKEIARLGYDPVFGARPLREVVENRIRAPLADLILKGDTVRGATITVDVQGDKFILKT